MGEGKKYFKESLLKELHNEIDEFVSETGAILASNCTIEEVDNKIKTSKGISVDAKEFRENLALYVPKFKTMAEGEEIKINKQVGKYQVERASKIEGGDVIIKAGCHKFSLNNILQNISVAVN